MTTPVATPTTTYTPALSSTGPFATVFGYNDPTELVVTRVTLAGVATVLLSPADYTAVPIGGNSLANGGNITVSAAVVPVGGWAGTTVTIERRTSLDQQANLGNTAGFLPASQETALDKVTRGLQDVWARLGRAVTGPPGSTGWNLPSAVGNGGKVLGLTAGLLLGWQNAGGADAALRTDLASGASGAALIAFQPSGIGAVVRTLLAKLLDSRISVKDFGAVGDGVTDDTPAFNAAAARANLLASGITGTYRGARIYAPDGLYLVSGSTTAITSSGVTWIGESRRGTIIAISAANAAFTWSGNAFGGGMENLTWRYPAAPANTARVLSISGAGQLHFENIACENLNTLVELGTDAAHTSSYSTFRNITGYVYNSGKATFRARWGVGLNIDGCSLYVTGVGVPAQDRVSTMTTVAGTRFLEMVDGGWDTVIIDGNTQTNRYDNAIYINAPLAVINNVFADKTCIFDYNSGDAVSINAPTGGSGGVVNVNIHSEYIFSWSGHGVVLTGNNINRLHSFEGAKVTGAGKDGFNISGSATGNINFNGIFGITCNRLNGGYVGLRIAAGTSHFTCNGSHLLYYVPGLSSPWGGDYAVTIGADCNNFTVKDTDTAGGVGQFNLADNTSNSAWRFIGNNPGADYSGVKTTGMFTTAATTVSKLNFSPFKVQVVYRFLDDLVVNGQQVYGAIPAQTGNGIFEWMPGEQFTAYYTAGGQIHYWVHV